MIPKQILDKARIDMQDVADIAAMTGVSYFKGAFRKKGFDGTPWPLAKKDKAGTRRRGSLMIDSAALMNSIRIARATPQEVVWTAGNAKVPYAEVHNTGGRAGRGRGGRQFGALPLLHAGQGVGGLVEDLVTFARTNRGDLLDLRAEHRAERSVGEALEGRVNLVEQLDKPIGIGLAGCGGRRTDQPQVRRQNLHGHPVGNLSASADLRERNLVDIEQRTGPFDRRRLVVELSPVLVDIGQLGDLVGQPLLNSQQNRFDVRFHFQKSFSCLLSSAGVTLSSSLPGVFK